MIALLTDFGIDDNYAGIVKGVLKSISSATYIVDITHSVKPYSILNGQYFLSSAYSYFPPGTVFYVVVDPGTEKNRKCLIVETEDHLFTAPDNGLLSPLKNSIKKLYEIDLSLFPNASATFQGRDIFAPVAAGLASGKKPGEFGRETEEMVIHKFPNYNPDKGFIEGKVLHLDRFGNVITSIPSTVLDLPAQMKILISSQSGDFPVKYASTYFDLSQDDAGIFYGSSGFIELSMNMKQLAKERDIQIEEDIKIVYE